MASIFSSIRHDDAGARHELQRRLVVRNQLLLHPTFELDGDDGGGAPGALSDLDAEMGDRVLEEQFLAGERAEVETRPLLPSG